MVIKINPGIEFPLWAIMWQKDYENRQNFDWKILSLNLFIRPPGITAKWNDYKTERMKEFLSYFASDYSIICLQEVFGTLSTRRSHLISELTLMGYECAWSGNSCNDLLLSNSCCLIAPHITDGGLVIAVKGTISQTSERIFAHGKGADALAAKGILYVKANTIHGPIQVYNLHLQAHDDVKSKKIRKGQLEEIYDFIRCTLDRTCVAVIAGDFNIDCMDSDNISMIKAYLKAPEGMFLTNVNTMNGTPSQPTFGLLPEGSVLAQSWYPEKAQMIDLIWTMVPFGAGVSSPLFSGFEVKNFECSIKECGNISDHAGITCTLSFNKASEQAHLL